jgi:hypothetical protein
MTVILCFARNCFDALLLLIYRENSHRSSTRLQINACEYCLLPPSYMQLGTLTH